MEKSSKGLLYRAQQDRVSEQRGLPVEVVTDSQYLRSVSSETVQLYYYTAGGVLTQDAGQLAGTIVVGKLAYGCVLTSIGDVIATHMDKSLSFTSTALTTEVAFPSLIAESYLQQHGHTKANAITQDFSNGQYCVDYRSGTIYGKKTTNTTTLTSTTYKISSTQGNVVLEAGDLEIGAVEIKNSSSDDRAVVKTGSSFVPGDLAIGVADVSTPTTLTGGSKTKAAAAGVGEVLGASLATKSIYIRAKSTNTNNVFIGDSTVDANQIILAANDSVTIDIANRASVYVDVTTGGEGVDYLCCS